MVTPSNVVTGAYPLKHPEDQTQIGDGPDTDANTDLVDHLRSLPGGHCGKLGFAHKSRWGRGPRRRPHHPTEPETEHWGSPRDGFRSRCNSERGDRR